MLKLTKVVIGTRGFTLIELMVVVAIVGIIAAIGYPSYTQHIAKAARTDAITALMRVTNLQEQYYLDHKSYTSNMTNLGLSSPLVTEKGFYNVAATVTGTNNDSFTITATANTLQAARDSNCGTISITSTGARTPEGCWN